MKPGAVMIPVSEPLLDAQARANAMEALDTSWISSEGRFIPEFERRWAEYCGVRHGVSLCNGTAALQLATEAL
jgi:perosamine synthetase